MDATPNETSSPQPRLGGELQQGEASHVSCPLQRQDARRGHEKKSRGCRTSPIVGPIRSMLRVGIAVYPQLRLYPVLGAQCLMLDAQCPRNDVGLGVLAHLADFPCSSHAKSRGHSNLCDVGTRFCYVVAATIAPSSLRRLCTQGMLGLTSCT